MVSRTIRAVVELDAADVQIVAAPPTHLSQRTSEAVLGIPRRAYLESLASYPGEVIRLGRLRIVDRVSYLRWLAGRAVGAVDDDAADLAAAAGLRIVASDKR